MKINYNSEDEVDHDAVAAIIKNDAGEVLVQDHIKYGFWTIPVGKVKSGQDIQNGLEQEIFEECNLTIEVCRELCKKDYFYERNGKLVKVVTHLFEVFRYSGILRNNEPQKHREQIYLPLSKIVELPYISDSTVLYLDQIGFNRKARL